MKIIIVLMGLGLSFHMMAQSSGYLGKRLLLGYGFNASPVLVGSSINHTTLIGNMGNAKTGVLALNAIHEGYMEYVKSNAWMICMNVRFYKTTYDNAEYLYNKQLQGYYNITGLSYGLYVKCYGPRYIAPWGSYIMFGPSIHTIKTMYDPSVMKMTYDQYSQVLEFSDFGPRIQHATSFDFMIGCGRTRIINQKITVDYGCNLYVLSLLAIPKDFLGLDMISYGTQESLSNANYIKHTSQNRVRGINCSNVFLRIGGLLF